MNQLSEQLHNEANIKCGIYCIRFAGSNRVYIGSSKNINRRENEHTSSLKRGVHINKKLQASFNKHGLENMTMYPVCFCAESELEAKENEWIKKFDSYKNGLNSQPLSSATGRIVSDKTRAKIGLAHRGKKLSVEQRKSISEASINQPTTSRLQAALKKLGKQRPIEAVIATANWHRGRKRSVSTRENISRSLSKLTEKDARKIDELIKLGIRYCDIAKQFGVSNQTICNIRNRVGVLFKHLGPPPELNVFKSKEYKERMSKAQTGKKASYEARLKMSMARRGKKFNEDHKRKISEALKRHHNLKRAIQEIDNEPKNICIH